MAVVLPPRRTFDKERSEVNTALASRIEEKVVRHVRTPAGQRRFGQPIGSIIVSDGASPLAHLRTTGNGKVRDTNGVNYHVGRHDGKWMAITEDGEEIASGKTEADVLTNLDNRVGGKPGTSGRNIPARGSEAQNKFPGMHPATPEELAAYKEKYGKAIPPAWTEVYISDDLDNAKLHVRGRDSKGRGQNVYSQEHSDNAAEAKFTRVQEFNKHLDKLDAALARDAMDNDHAAALLLIRRLGMRPGSNRDTGAEKEAHGATNLKGEHVTVDEDGTVHLDFTGKKGVHIQLSFKDPLIADMLRKRLAARGNQPGVQLFETNEDKTRQYMKSTGVPDDFLLKDLRTVHANVVALREIAKRGNDKPQTQREYQKWRKEIGVLVSNELGNTPALALASYINPTVFAPWQTDESWA